MARKRYPSDLTNKQWKLIKPHLPGEKTIGRPRETDLREVLNALFYICRSGCSWAMIPEGFPPRSTVHGYFKAWQQDGTFDEIMRVLREGSVANRRLVYTHLFPKKLDLCLVSVTNTSKKKSF